MEIQEIMKVLVKDGISTSMHYNSKKDQLYLDLETQAKSDLHLYEDGILRGRYNYEKEIDLNQNIEALITELCYEFNDALHGRNYYQTAWGELCNQRNIELEIYYK